MKKIVSTYLPRTERDYGVVGKKTNFKDVNGNELCVGDMVEFELDFADGTFTEPIIDYCNNDIFIMGVQMLCYHETGTFDEEILSVRKVKDHSELNIGDVLSDGDLKVVYVEETV